LSKWSPFQSFKWKFRNGLKRDLLRIKRKRMKNKKMKKKEKEK
jgi:hypothetical protein